MSKIRIHIKSEDIGDVVKVTDKDTIHKIRNVLRLKASDNLLVFDGQGKEYSCRISQIDRNIVVLNEVSLQRRSQNSEISLALAFPMTKEESIDFILQKATELGVSKFIPFTSERSLNIKVSAAKFSRWRKIIIEAVRQSERLWIPKLADTISFSSLIKCSQEVKLAGAVDGESLKPSLINNSKDIIFAIGPVGDFSPGEYQKLKASGFKFVKLSDHLLKVETAAILGIGLINYFRQS